MSCKKYTEIRRKLRDYRLIEKELKSRTDYLNDFRKILINPLPETEKSLHKVYSAVVDDMQEKITKLRKRMNTIESIIDSLEGAERSVMYHRYIVGVEWIRIPECVMYEQRTCQFLEVDALEKIAEMNIDWE